MVTSANVWDMIDSYCTTNNKCIIKFNNSKIASASASKQAEVWTWYANFAEDFTSLRRDAGSRRQNDVTGIPREMDNLKSAGNLKFEDINIDEYLDDKIIQNTKMTNSIKSTLSRLDNVYGKPKSYTGVISEINSSEEEKWASNTIKKET